MNKRIWIVGNGVSLKETPLDLLKNEDTFGMNRIFDLDFHPTYYFCIDVGEGDVLWKKSVDANPQAQLFLWDAFKGQTDREATWITRCARHHFYSSDNVDKRVQSWHLPELCTAIGSLSPMLQLSVLMGYEKIYLVGCDLWQAGAQNHYTQNYYAAHEAGTQDIERRNRDALYLHEMAKRDCPIPIYNATVGGGLEIYPRVDIRKVLQ